MMFMSAMVMMINSVVLMRLVMIMIIEVYEVGDGANDDGNDNNV